MKIVKKKLVSKKWMMSLALLSLQSMYGMERGNSRYGSEDFYDQDAAQSEAQRYQQFLNQQQESQEQAEQNDYDSGSDSPVVAENDDQKDLYNAIDGKLKNFWLAVLNHARTLKKFRAEKYVNKFQEYNNSISQVRGFIQDKYNEGRLTELDVEFVDSFIEDTIQEAQTLGVDLTE